MKVEIQVLPEYDEIFLKLFLLISDLLSFQHELISLQAKIKIPLIKPMTFISYNLQFQYQVN